MSYKGEIGISAENLSKCYHLYKNPADRLKQAILPFGKQYYQEFWALNDVSFDIKAGESVGIVGRNGSGKSTLLQLVSGIVSPTVGSTKINGRVAALLELGSGFNPEFSGRENVYLNASLLGLSRDEVDARFDKIVEFSELGDFIDQPVRTYSSGMFVRLAFSVIAHVDADVLIVDEALAVGDAFFVQKCMRFMREFLERGTMLFVSHDTSSVINLCDKAIWLKDGEVALEGDAKDICEQYVSDSYAEKMGISKRSSPKAITKATQPSKPEGVATEQDKTTPGVDDSDEATNKLQGSQVIKGRWFDEGSASFGTEQSQIVNVELLDEQSDELQWLRGGEPVRIRIEIRCNEAISDPIIGFSVKDRLGQHLFGDNSSATYAGGRVSADAGQLVCAEFAFDMPLLLTGDYTVCAAVATGTMDHHVQHHWMHDALVFRVDSSSLAGVLVGIPINSVEISVQSDDAETRVSAPRSS